MSSRAAAGLTHSRPQKERAVGQLVVSEFITLDVVFEDPGGAPGSGLA
jgi:hypothetical protein